MRISRIAAAASVALVLALSACGGSGHGFGVAANPVVIASNALPPTLSGQVVNHLIPFTGGSGGPYLLERIAGTMPDGVGTENQTVALAGRALEDGVFDFTLRLTDTGSSPFTTSIQSFHWVIGIGPLVFATDTVLPGTVFNAFTSIQLTVAGGIPPYSCEVVDLPGFPDEPLPTGMAIPPDSTSIVGAPQQAHPGAAPFIVSIQANDSTPGTPLTTVKTFQVPVLIPPIIVTTLSLPDGKCGTTYDGQVDVADGVPPFLHSVVDPNLDIGVLPYDVQAHRLRGEPGSPNGVAKGAFPSGYALEATASPYTGKFPEGICLRDATGTLLGKPRRTGTFSNWMYNVQSTLLPGEASQNRWKAFSFTMTNSVPPALVMDPLSMPAGQGYAAPSNKLPDLEVGISYSHTWNALNGVPYDGKYDSPHEADAITKPGEQADKYDWSSTTFQLPGRPGNLGMQFTNLGVFSTTSPAGVTGTKGGYENINLVVKDQQLPSASQHVVTGTVQFAIGPDSVVITESSLSTTNNFVDATYEVPDQTVEIFDAYSLTPTVRQLSASDLAATHTNPTGLALSSALKNIDFLSVTVNPTWWAYDNYNLCALGARAAQHADLERRYTIADYNSDVFIKMQNGGMPAEGFENSSNNAIELPETTAVAHSPATGVYANGGLLYAYDNPSQAEYGFFVVRKDSRIYIPFSIAKSSSATAFGDGWITSTLAAKSMLRKPQITVSPDGRFAAAKIKADVNNFLELASASRIVIFSLTGEKPFGGQTWRVITTGASGTTNDGQYLYADSLTLTNRYLYWMTGNYAGNTQYSMSSSEVIWREHWVWRYDLTRSSAPYAGALLSPSYNSNWTNTPIGASGALSTTWHRWSTPGTTGTFNSTTFEPSYTSSSSFSSPGTNMPATDFFAYNFANFAENSMATVPFRVSRNGKAIAIIAAPNTFAGGTFSSSNFQRYGIYVDYDQGGGTTDNAVFRMASTLGANRRFRGAARNGGLRSADDGYNYRMMGRYDGPASQMEISDDGTKVAAVYNAYTSTWYPNNGTSNAPRGREDLALYTAGDPGSSTDPWSSASENDTITNGVFTGSIIWRFGCLAFTRDGSAVVFWGGYGLYSPTSTTYYYTEVNQMSGSLYAYNILTNTRQGILNNSEGGHVDVTSGYRNYSTGSQNSSVATNWSGNQGAVGPIGAFYSNDGKFFWMESHGALTTSNDTPNRLVGVNVAGDPSIAGNTINGRAPLRAFAPSWPNRRGFGVEGYYYYPNIRIRGGLGASGSRLGQQISAAGHKGLVFYASYYTGNNTGQTSDSATTSFQGGGPAHPTAWPDYGIQAGEMFVIDTSVGGQPFQLTNLGGTYSPYRMINYIQANRAGNRLAFVHNPSYYNTYPSWTGYSHFTNTEQIVLISNITTNATTGALTASAVTTVEGSVGRAGASMAFDFTDSRLYYAFTTGGNENAQSIIEKRFDPLTATVQGTRTQTGLNGTTNRFAILNSGR